ncbi:MAG: MFS transporter [Christensenellales bacterium]|jgi:Na+/melibiose symporter-like transporter
MNENNLKLDPGQKVPLKEKLFFGAADIFGGGAQALISTVFLVFLVNVGIDLKLAGVIVMISKLWDAVSDPMVGIISDNTRTKWGRRRPYMFAGGFLIIISLLLMFIPLHGMSNKVLKFSFYLFSYLFYCTVSTIIMVPYSSMSTEISTDYDEKTRVNTIRLIFSMASSGISALIPTELADRLNNGTMTITQFSIIMICVFGTFYCIPMVLAAIKCKERANIPQEKKKFSFKEFVRPLKVKAFVYLLIAYLFSYSCMDIITANIVFFTKFGLQIKMSSTVLLAVIMLSYAVTVPFLSVLMSKGWSKPKLMRTGIPLYIAGIVFLTVYPTIWFDIPEWPILIFCVMIGLGMSGCQMMPWIIFPDVIDVGELKLKDRPTGSFSGLMTFIKKTTSAIAIGITGLILDLTGFIEPVADQDGIVSSVTQPLSAVLGLRIMILVTVVLFVSITYIYAKKLKLDPKRSRKVTYYIGLQNEGKLDNEHMSEEDWRELKAIEEELF